MVRPRNHEQAFLLIEMIVAVAIVAILVALVAPVLATARKKVHQFDCSSRQRQLAKAVIMYTQDNDEWLPVGASFDYWTEATIWSWDAAVMGYTSYQGPMEGVAALARAGTLYQCPVDRLPRDGGVTRSFTMTLTGNGCGGPNQGVVGDWRIEGRSLYTSPRSLAELTDESGTLLLVEFYHPLNRLFGGWAAGIHGPLYAPGHCGTGPLAQEMPAAGPGSRAEPLNHLGGFNYVFCDTHSRWFRPSQTIGLRGKPGDPQGMWTISDAD